LDLWLSRVRPDFAALYEPLLLLDPLPLGALAV